MCVCVCVCVEYTKPGYHYYRETYYHYNSHCSYHNKLLKILEKTVHQQLENYLRSKILLYDYQSGFRNSYSTDSCLTHLTDQIRFDMDKGNYTGMVMIDLQKAFDTIDHNILLNKLKAISLDDL